MIRRRTDRVLDDFGLTAQAGQKVQDLSGGFKRRVQVAKIFMVETPVVFLDEFSTGMDPILKRSVMSALREEARKGRTIVLTTQILSEAEELCDDILIMNHGREVAHGDLQALKLLSEGVYEVSMTFDVLPDGLEAELVGPEAVAAGLHPDHGAVRDEGERPAGAGAGQRSRDAGARAAGGDRRREPRGRVRRAHREGGAAVVSVLSAVMYREAQIRITNLLFIFWDVLYPLGYLLVFGVGIDRALHFDVSSTAVNYHAFFLGGVLGMASFGIASNTAWSFFLDRDNGIFYEMLTYPMSRSEYLLGKVLFNVFVALVQAAVTIVLAAYCARGPDRVAAGAARGRRRRRRDRRLVLFLRHLCADHAAQRRVQYRDVDLLFRVSVRELDVLSTRPVAVGIEGRSPTPTPSRGRSICCDMRRLESDDRRSWCSKPSGSSCSPC